MGGGCTRAAISPDPPTGERLGGELLREARGGGVELFQAACIRLPFDHYIIAAHAAPAVHS